MPRSSSITFRSGSSLAASFLIRCARIHLSLEKQIWEDFVGRHSYARIPPKTILAPHVSLATSRPWILYQVPRKTQGCPKAPHVPVATYPGRTTCAGYSPNTQDPFGFPLRYNGHALSGKLEAPRTFPTNACPIRFGHTVSLIGEPTKETQSTRASPFDPP
jgi:hypothetical protein